jgi:hypothetical protein
MTIREPEARALAILLHTIRPSWGIEATVKVLGRNREHTDDIGALILAAVTAARDPETQTPARIFQVEKHWPADLRGKLPKPPPCVDHPEQEAPTCRCCHADVKVGLRPANMIGKHYEPESENA